VVFLSLRLFIASQLRKSSQGGPLHRYEAQADKVLLALATSAEARASFILEYPEASIDVALQQHRAVGLFCERVIVPQQTMNMDQKEKARRSLSSRVQAKFKRELKDAGVHPKEEWSRMSEKEQKPYIENAAELRKLCRDIRKAIKGRYATGTNLHMRDHNVKARIPVPDGTLTDLGPRSEAQYRFTKVAYDYGQKLSAAERAAYADEATKTRMKTWMLIVRISKRLEERAKNEIRLLKEVQ